MDPTAAPGAPAANANANAGAFAWEQTYDRPWEFVHEDEQGKLTVTKDLQGGNHQRQRKLHDDYNGQPIRRGMLRAVVICLDTSAASGERDLKPSRLVAGAEALEGFVERFHDENPLSTLGILATSEGRAYRVTELSRNATSAVRGLRQVSVGAGSPSLQNALILGLAMLSGTPSYVSKEMIFLVSSMNVVDPGDVFVCIERARTEKVRCSVIHLAALMEVYRVTAEKTEGRFGVAKDVTHLSELLSEHLTPPPAARSAVGRDGAGLCSFVRMGFPSQRPEDDTFFGGSDEPQPAYCVDVDTIHMAPYYCPKCRTPTSTLPATCRVCGLQLIASSHLARSYHHLFPVPDFVLLTQQRSTTTCFSCGDAQGTLTCPKCHLIVCDDCDQVIHESLFACPCCLTLSSV